MTEKKKSLDEKKRLNQQVRDKVGVLSEMERDETMANELMYIPNDNIQNNPFCRLQLVLETFGPDTQLNKPTNHM